MKAIKTIVIILVALVALVFVVSLFLPSQVHVERDGVVNASIGTTFGQVNDLTEWKSWSYWDNIDPEMKESFEGPDAGVGAIKSWESEHPQVGKGKMTITESMENEKIVTEMEFDGQGNATGTWSFEEADGGVKVTVAMDMDMGMNPIGKFMGLMMEDWIGSDFEKTLAGLKKKCESMPQTADVPVMEKMIEAQTALFTVDSCTLDMISDKLEEMFGKLMQALGPKPHEMMGGMPFAIYHKWDPQGMIHIEAGIPVMDEFESTAEVRYGEIEAGNTVMAIHMGAYDKAETAHKAIDAYIEANGKELRGAPWEVYANDPEEEPDTSKWITEIYYPVK